jgi:hypothetical protein
MVLEILDLKANTIPQSYGYAAASSTASETILMASDMLIPFNQS